MTALRNGPCHFARLLDDDGTLAEGLDVFNDLGPESDAGVPGEASDPVADNDAADDEPGGSEADGDPVDGQADPESGLLGDPAPTASIGGSDAGEEADSSLFGSPDVVEQEANQQGEVTPTDPRVAVEENEADPEDEESTWDEDWPYGPPPDEPPPPPPPPDDGNTENEAEPPGSGESYPVDTGFEVGELEPIDFSPPEELINPPEPTIPGQHEMAEPDATVGDGIIDPRTINPDPSGSESTNGGDGEGESDGEDGPGVVDPVGPDFTTDDPSFTADRIESLEPLDPDGDLEDFDDLEMFDG